MTGKEFLNSLANGQPDIIEILLGIITKIGSPYCVIGGLAVNAYVEPVVSLDIDIVITVKNVEAICRAAEKQGLKSVGSGKKGEAGADRQWTSEEEGESPGKRK